MLQTNSMYYNFTVSLSVGEATETDDSSTQKVADDDSNNNTSAEEKSGQLLTVAASEPSTSYAQSPTFRAVQQMKAGSSDGDSQSAVHQAPKDGEEMRYRGYTNPHKQSRSFQMLEQGLRMSESGQGLFVCVEYGHFGSWSVIWLFHSCCCTVGAEFTNYRTIITRLS